MSDDEQTPHARKERRDDIETELQARIAEVEWLKSHYDEQLRAAFAQIASLQTRLQTLAAERDAEIETAPAMDLTNLDVLRQEIGRLTEAEKRYLDRIEELKELNAHAG